MIVLWCFVVCLICLIHVYYFMFHWLGVLDGVFRTELPGWCLRLDVVYLLIGWCYSSLDAACLILGG